MLTLKCFPLTWKAANQHKFSPILLFSHLNMHFVTIQQHHAKSTFSLAVSAKSWTQYYFKNWFSISGSFEIPWFNSCGGSQQLPTRSRVPSPVLCTWTYRTRMAQAWVPCMQSEWGALEDQQLDSGFCSERYVKKPHFKMELLPQWQWHN